MGVGARGKPETWRICVVVARDDLWTNVGPASGVVSGSCHHAARGLPVRFYTSSLIEDGSVILAGNDTRGSFAISCVHRGNVVCR